MQQKCRIRTNGIVCGSCLFAGDCLCILIFFFRSVVNWLLRLLIHVIAVSVCLSFVLFFFCFKSAFVHLFRFVISSYAIVIIVCRVLMVVDVGRAFVAFHLEKTPKAREKKHINDTDRNSMFETVKFKNCRYFKCLSHRNQYHVYRNLIDSAEAFVLYR